MVCMPILLLPLLAACAHHPSSGAAVDPRIAAFIKEEATVLPPPAACADIVGPLAQLGSILYQRDQAAWHATDAAMPMLTLFGSGTADSMLARGWLVEDRGDQLVVEWLTARSGTPEVLIEVPVSFPGYTAVQPQVPGVVDAFAGNPDSVSNASIRAAAKSRPMTDSEAAQFAAVTLALGQDQFPKAEHVNFVAVDLGAGEWWVYLLPATTREDVAVMGGAVQVVVKGGAIEQVIHHGYTVFENPLQGPKGEKAAGYLSLPSMQCPSETLVFTSLQYDDLPIVLVASTGLWGIRGATMSYLGPAPAQ
jgi:hypothetical protein